jgi:hypothetical protein
VLDAAAVDVAVAGQDAVIDALGGKTPWKVTTMETSAAHNIVDAMRRNGVRRLLKISVVGAGESVKNAGFFNEHVLMRTFLKGLLVDKAGMERGLADTLQPLLACSLWIRALGTVVRASTGPTGLRFPHSRPPANAALCRRIKEPSHGHAYGHASSRYS